MWLQNKLTSLTYSSFVPLLPPLPLILLAPKIFLSLLRSFLKSLFLILLLCLFFFSFIFLNLFHWLLPLPPFLRSPPPPTPPPPLLGSTPPGNLILSENLTRSLVSSGGEGSVLSSRLLMYSASASSRNPPPLPPPPPPIDGDPANSSGASRTDSKILILSSRNSDRPAPAGVAPTDSRVAPTDGWLRQEVNVANSRINVTEAEGTSYRIYTNELGTFGIFEFFQ